MKTLRAAILAATLLAMCSAPFADAMQQQQQLNALGNINRVSTTEKPDQKTLNRLAQEVEKNPDSVDARCALADCYDRLGLPDLANEQYSLAAKVAPNNPHLWMLRVKQQLKDGKTKEAFHLIETAHERFGNDPEVLFWYGNMLAAKNQNDNAAYAYQLAMKQDKDIEGLRSALGQLCLDQQRWGDALVLANQELRQHPDFPLAYKVKGFALVSMDKFDQALQPLRIAYLAYNKQAPLARAYAHTALWNGEYEEALEPALAYLHSTASLTSDDKGAKQLFLRALERVPKDKVRKNLPDMVKKLHIQKGNPAFFFALGDTLDTAGLNDMAIDYYTLGLRMEPNFARGLFRLGKDYEFVKHDYTTALLLYKAAYAHSPNDPEIATYYIRLNDRFHNRPNDLAWQLRDWLKPAAPVEQGNGGN